MIVYVKQTTPVTVLKFHEILILLISLDQYAKISWKCYLRRKHYLLNMYCMPANSAPRVHLHSPASSLVDDAPNSIFFPELKTHYSWSFTMSLPSYYSALG
jgi:hypothetical protein